MASKDKEKRGSRSLSTGLGGEGDGAFLKALRKGKGKERESVGGGMADSVVLEERSDAEMEEAGGVDE
jgi:hypothetical protein